MSLNLHESFNSSKKFTYLNAICMPAAIFDAQGVLVDKNLLFTDEFSCLSDKCETSTLDQFISRFETINFESDEIFNAYESRTREAYQIRTSAYFESGSLLNLLIVENISQLYQSLRRNFGQQMDLLQISRDLSAGEITTTIAHELNQPIGAIYNYLSIALNAISDIDPPISDIPVTAIKEALAQTEYSASVIKGIREFARGTSPQFQACEPESPVYHVLGLFKLDIIENSIKYSIEIDEDLPFVNMDPTMIYQVLSNLIRNAIEAMKHRPISQRLLSVSVSRRGEHIQFSIADSGEGVPQNVSNRVFSPFFTTKESGTGIGLAICKSIVELHNGHLCFDSNSGKGCTFLFTLPALAGAPFSEHPSA